MYLLWFEMGLETDSSLDLFFSLRAWREAVVVDECLIKGDYVCVLCVRNAEMRCFIYL